MFIRNYNNELKLEKVDPIIKNQIRDYYNMSAKFEFLDQVAAVLDRINYKEAVEALEGDNLYELIYENVDSEIVSNDQKFILIMYYCSPEEADFQEALDCFNDDIYNLVKSLLQEGFEYER